MDPESGDDFDLHLEWANGPPVHESPDPGTDRRRELVMRERFDPQHGGEVLRTTEGIRAGDRMRLVLALGQSEVELRGAIDAIDARAASLSDQPSGAIEEVREYIAAAFDAVRELTSQLVVLTDRLELAPGRPRPEEIIDVASARPPQALTVTSGDIASEIAAEVASEIAGEIRGGIANEIRGGIANEIRGDIANEIRGELASEIRGEIASELRSGLASELQSGIADQIAAARGDIAAVREEIAAAITSAQEDWESPPPVPAVELAAAAAPDLGELREAADRIERAIARLGNKQADMAAEVTRLAEDVEAYRRRVQVHARPPVVTDAQVQQIIEGLAAAMQSPPTAGASPSVPEPEAEAAPAPPPPPAPVKSSPRRARRAATRTQSPPASDPQPPPTDPDNEGGPASDAAPVEESAEPDPWAEPPVPLASAETAETLAETLKALYSLPTEPEPAPKLSRRQRRRAEKAAKAGTAGQSTDEVAEPSEEGAAGGE